MKSLFVVSLILLFVTLSTAAVQNFRGVHFDVEPYTLSSWATNETGLFNAYLDLLEKLAEELNGTGLELAVDVPFWYYSRNLTRDGQQRPYHEYVMDRVDRMCSMDYRAYAWNSTGWNPATARTDGIIRNGRDYVNYATKVGKKVTLIVETTQQIQYPYTSFYNSTTTYMESQLEIVHNYFSNMSGFASVAIHHHNSWALMTPDYNVTNGVPRDTFQWTYATAFNPASRTQLLEFCKSHKVDTIYVESESTIKNNQQALIDFIHAAAEYDINVEALFGAASWAQSNQHAYAVGLASYAVQLAETLNALTTTSGTSTSSSTSGSTGTISTTGETTDDTTTGGSDTTTTTGGEISTTTTTESTVTSTGNYTTGEETTNMSTIGTTGSDEDNGVARQCVTVLSVLCTFAFLL